MICISIVQESRRFALVDMLNASRQCDLLEVRLDHFSKAPDISELLGAKPKPVIFSCRRPQDGGFWEGSESDRLALLRQCIIGKAEYCEIELDVADQIRKFPPTKRVISYTNLQETPSNLAEIYAECQKKSPDVIKLTTLARTPEEAWPLIQIMVKPALPTVVVGLGKPGLMLSVLGKKIGSPWTYAALERGMEAYPGQPTVHDLTNVYHYHSIQKNTRLVGMTGFTDLEYFNTAALNAAFTHLESNTRCLPIQVGNVKLFSKVINLVKLVGVVIDEDHRKAILEIAGEAEPAATQARSADLLVNQGDKWQAYNLLGRAAADALKSAMQARGAGDQPLKGRTVMIVGANSTARGMTSIVQKLGGIPIIASHSRDAALELAQAYGCRQCPFESLFTTRHEVLIVCSEDKEHLKGKVAAAQGQVHSGYLSPDMAVMDLTRMPRRTTLTRDAEKRGCIVVPPRQVLLNLLELQVRLLSGKNVPRATLDEVWNSLVQDEDE